MPVDGPDQAPVDQVIAAIDGVGWSGVRMDAAARLRLAALVQLVSAELLTVDAEILGFYARLADHLCRTEIALIDNTKDRQGTLEDMVIGEAVFGDILTLFRRLGHEHYHEQRRREAVDCRVTRARPLSASASSRGGRSRPPSPG